MCACVPASVRACVCAMGLEQYNMAVFFCDFPSSFSDVISMHVTLRVISFC